LRKGLEGAFSDAVSELEQKYYRDVKRFAGTAFRRAELGKKISMAEWDPQELYDEFDENHDGSLSLEEVRDGMATKFQINLTNSQLALFRKEKDGPLFTDKESFSEAVREILKHSV